MDTRSTENTAQGAAGPDLAGGRPGTAGGRPGPSGVFEISERDWLSNYRVLKNEGFGRRPPVWWEAWGPGPPGLPLNPALGSSRLPRLICTKRSASTASENAKIEPPKLKSPRVGEWGSKSI